MNQEFDEALKDSDESTRRLERDDLIEDCRELDRMIKSIQQFREGIAGETPEKRALVLNLLSIAEDFSTGRFLERRIEMEKRQHWEAEDRGIWEVEVFKALIDEATSRISKWQTIYKKLFATYDAFRRTDIYNSVKESYEKSKEKFLQYLEPLLAHVKRNGRLENFGTRSKYGVVFRIGVGEVFRAMLQMYFASWRLEEVEYLLRHGAAMSKRKTGKCRLGWVFDKKNMGFAENWLDDIDPREIHIGDEMMQEYSDRREKSERRKKRKSEPSES